MIDNRLTMITVSEGILIVLPVDELGLHFPDGIVAVNAGEFLLGVGHDLLGDFLLDLALDVEVLALGGCEVAAHGLNKERSTFL